MTEAGDAMLAQVGSRVFYPSDEWFIRAELPIPDSEFYEEYPQLENGVGMIALLRECFREELHSWEGTPDTARTVLVSGTAAAPFIRELVAEATAKYPSLNAEVVAIKNEFFGENITVSGLVTGGDLIRQLKGVPMDRLLVPANMLRREGDCFLDDVTVEQVASELGTVVEIIPETDGATLFAALVNDTDEMKGEDSNG
jgi:NifB/MoaA-like Fe-S oxidoreductase